MAPPKTVTEVPRSILPRLTWNGTSARTTVTPLSTGYQSQQHRRIQGWNTVARQLHTLTLSPYSSRFLTTAAASRDFASSAVTRRSTSSTHRPSVGPISNPIRYNGVYVAVFKTARRAFHATASRQRDHHFDTLKFVQRLKAEGFSEEQAVAMMRVLNDVIQESIQNLTRTMVLREGQWSVYRCLAFFNMASFGTGCQNVCLWIE